MNLSTEPQTAGSKPAPEAAIRKFMFERSFEGAQGVVRSPARTPVTLKPEQVDALKKEAYETGFAAGKKAGVDDHGRGLQATLSQLEKKVASLIENLQSIKQQQDAEMRGAVIAICRKILPDFTSKNGLQEIEAVLGNVIGEMAHEPRLVVRIHESQFEDINAKVNDISTQKAYSGKIVVLADNNIAPGDCLVEWADGGVERNTQQIIKTIEQAVGGDQVEATPEASEPSPENSSPQETTNG